MSAGPPAVGAAPVEPRDAATVILIRDVVDSDPPRGSSGAGHGIMEVLLLRRPVDASFAAGAHVFPGGAVDQSDRADGVEAICTGRPGADADRLLGVSGGGLAWWVAGIRECFEEAGVLLARAGQAGTLVSFADPDTAGRFSAYREALHRGELDLVGLCRVEGLTLAVDGIHYFSHWVTPEGSPRRFDTRFFVATAPEGQVAVHDDRETTEELWVRPADALSRYRSGEIELLLPTVTNLEAICRYRHSAELVAAARSLATVTTVRPRMVSRDGQVRVLMPGDDGYG